MGPRTALLVVDVQPTFCEGGELPVAGGNEIATRIAAFVHRHAGDYQLVVTSQDWHIDPTGHFAAEPDFDQTWPPHGLAGSANAELHPDLVAVLAGVSNRVAVRKGQHAAAYSAFEGTTFADGTLEGTPLGDVLTAGDITEVDVCGIAESHCVRASALDALRLGFGVRMIGDLTVPVTAAGGAAARREVLSAGGRLATSDEL